jgi:enolase
MPKIEQVRALEILDSRGRPTVKAWCRLAPGHEAAASVPSGASTGMSEALELRDGDTQRYGGLGCTRAVANINHTIQKKVAGRSFENQGQLDSALLELDGTPNKSLLGANAILAVSLAFARAEASMRGLPLHRLFAERLGASPRTLPRPTINLFSGGKHAGAQAPLQDVLVVPVCAKSIEECLATTFRVYQSAAQLTARKYRMRLLRADEGGLAPPFATSESMLEDAVAAISAAGFKPGREVALAVDAAATHFYAQGQYDFGNEKLSSSDLIGQWERWTQRFPIVSLEDGLAEDDWEHWPLLRQRLAGRCLIVGDDLLCTNPARIRRAVQLGAADALLLKVNQIGTLSEALEACRLARAAQWSVTVSARSGETEDDWLADLAVGWSGDQIKIGSITQSERLSKYNRLLEIEAATRLPLVSWPQPVAPVTTMHPVIPLTSNRGDTSASLGQK